MLIRPQCRHRPANRLDIVTREEAEKFWNIRPLVNTPTNGTKPTPAEDFAKLLELHETKGPVPFRPTQRDAAGAQVRMPLEDMFWGDRYGVLADPFGHAWSLATHKEDLKPEEIAARAQTAFSGCAPRA